MQERHHSALGEALLALDPHDGDAVPQLMRLQPRSPLALSKALATCSTDLALHVLLHSFEELAHEGLRLDAASDAPPPVRRLERQASRDAPRFGEFYGYLRDPAAGSEGPRGVVPQQAYGLWNAFVHSMAAPLPDAHAVRSSASWTASAASTCCSRGQRRSVD